MHELARLLHDNKLLLGIRYAEWSVRAPTLEASIAISAMAQDELGHARVLAPIGKGEDFWLMPPLRRAFPSWRRVVAVAWIVDGLMTRLMEHALETELGSRLKKAIQEERYHRIYASGWLQRLKGDRPLAEELSRVGGWMERFCGEVEERVPEVKDLWEAQWAETTEAWGESLPLGEEPPPEVELEPEVRALAEEKYRARYGVG